MARKLLLPGLIAVVWHVFIIATTTESFSAVVPFQHTAALRRGQQGGSRHYVHHPLIVDKSPETSALFAATMFANSTIGGGGETSRTIITQETLALPKVEPKHAAATATTTTSRIPGHISPLTDWDEWWNIKMQEWYRKALAIKCPFMRRRASDFLDGLDAILRYGGIAALGTPLAYRCEGDRCNKLLGLTLDELAVAIRKDWREDTCKGYYITGRLTTSLYRDDCLFDGPDPDMPVRGLRKYLNAASQLFDPAKSTSELLSLDVVYEDNVVVARWKMQGRLRLPWKPTLPVVSGKTTYHPDVSGLIYLHEETWDVSVFRAFLQTFWPEMAHKIWKDDKYYSTLPPANKKD